MTAGMRQGLIAVLLANVIGTGFAAGAKTWRMASKMPPDSPEGLAFQ